jgi:hypothetical protein
MARPQRGDPEGRIRSSGIRIPADPEKAKVEKPRRECQDAATRQSSAVQICSYPAPQPRKCLADDAYVGELAPSWRRSSSDGRCTACGVAPS